MTPTDTQTKHKKTALQDNQIKELSLVQSQTTPLVGGVGGQSPRQVDRARMLRAFPCAHSELLLGIKCHTLSHNACVCWRARLAACMLCTARRAPAIFACLRTRKVQSALTTEAWARSDGVVVLICSHACGCRSGIARAREMRWMCGLRVREINRKTACGVGDEGARICKIPQVKSETFVLRSRQYAQLRVAATHAGRVRSQRWADISPL